MTCDEENFKDNNRTFIYLAQLGNKIDKTESIEAFQGFLLIKQAYNVLAQQFMSTCA